MEKCEMISDHRGLWTQHPEGSAAASKLNNQERTGFRKWPLEKEQNLRQPPTGSRTPAFVHFDFYFFWSVPPHTKLLNNAAKFA